MNQSWARMNQPNPAANGAGDASGNMIQGNFIGTQSNGLTPLGNARIGVTFAHGAHDNLVGGTVAGAGNVVAFNGLQGVFASSAELGFPDTRANSILGNSIFSNGALAIDLVGDGVTPNDAADADTGANDLQNFPVITSVTVCSTWMRGFISMKNHWLFSRSNRNSIVPAFS